MARKVGIYTRISRDDEGEALGVARQRTDCERLADLRTWQPVKVYEDNDVSAFKRNVVREEFELMLKDLKAGLIDGVVSYDLDRLARQPQDLERLIEIYDDRPRLEFATVTNDVNLGTADGRTMARIMVAFANKSSHDTSRRLKRKHLELAQQGKSNHRCATLARPLMNEPHSPVTFTRDRWANVRYARLGHAPRQVTLIIKRTVSAGQRHAIDA